MDQNDVFIHKLKCTDVHYHELERGFTPGAQAHKKDFVSPNIIQQTKANLNEEHDSKERYTSTSNKKKKTHSVPDAGGGHKLNGIRACKALAALNPFILST